MVTSRGAREAGRVVIATPAGPTAGMLTDPTPAESALLRAPYSCGLVVGLGLAEPLRDDELGGAYGVMVMPDCPSPLAAIAVYSRADPSAGGEVLTVMFYQGATRLLTAADDATVRAAAINAVTPWLPGLASRVTDSHGNVVITALVAHARERGTKVLRLDTGDKQLSAITFYRHHGFVEVPRFGAYVGSATSICMQREVS